MPKPYARTVVLAILVMAAAAGAWRYFRPAGQATEGRQSQQSKPQGGPVRVPVHAAVARRTDFRIYLDSLGQAQPWNTVTVRSRVDGQIDKVAFDQGQMVKAGELLVQIDPRPFQATLGQAKAKKSLDEALLANTRRDLARYEHVGTLGNSQQQIDTQRALVTQQEAQIRQDAASVESAEVQLGYTTIRSPISGRVGFRLVDQGNIVHATDTSGVATIAQISPMAVVFTEPQEQLPRIQDALKAGPLAVTALTSDTRRVLGDGHLSLVDNQVDQASGSIRLKAEFENANSSLWPGLTVATRLLVETRKDVVVIPDAAVQRGPDKLFAYVVGKDNKAELRELKVAEIQNGQALVESGLAQGEQVVTSGYYRLAPGAAIEVRGAVEGAQHTAERDGAKPKPAAVKVE